MAKSNSTPKIRKSAAVPAQSKPSAEPVLVPYVDYNRDARDTSILAALRAATQILGDGSDSDAAMGILFLIEDRLTADADTEFTAEVADHV